MTSASRTRLQRKWAHRVIVWGGILVLWQVIAERGSYGLLPPVSDVLKSMIAAITNGDLLTLMGSFRQGVVGFGLAAVIGISLGVSIGAFPVVNAILGMYIRALYVLVLEAVLPFLILAFGTKFNFRVAVVFLFSLCNITLNTFAGIRSVDPALLETAAAFCTPRWRGILTVIVPSILPYILAGLRLGFGDALRGMIIAELWVLVDTGERLTDLSINRQLDQFFALALWILIIGVLCIKALRWLQSRFVPWSSSEPIR